jgi:hypothetical protein
MNSNKYMESYDTIEAAEADGWTRTRPTGWTVKDVSSAGSYGYDKVAISPDGTRQAATTAVWIRTALNRMGRPGVNYNMYRRADFE